MKLHFSILSRNSPYGRFSCLRVERQFLHDKILPQATIAYAPPDKVDVQIRITGCLPLCTVGCAACSQDYLDFIICPHNVNVWNPYSSTQHRGACTACGTYLYGSHYAQVGGMGTCLVCGYYGNMPGLTSTGHETE